MKIKLIKPHLGYAVGRELDVSDTGGKYLIDQGIALSKSKSLESPPQDKMMRDYPKKANRNRKITSETMGTKRK